MALVVDYALPAFGFARTQDSGAGLVPADDFNGFGDFIPLLGDGLAATGYAMAPTMSGVVDRNQLIAALMINTDPEDHVPLDVPIPTQDWTGYRWAMILDTDDPMYSYGFPPVLVDTGYTVTLGLGQAPGGGGFSGSGQVFDLVTGTTELGTLIETGRTVDPIPFRAVVDADVAAVNAGTLMPYVGIDGPRSSLDPLLLVANLTLCIVHDDAPTPTVTVLTATRQFPRDDTLGLGSATRIHPPPRSGRIAGGHQ